MSNNTYEGCQRRTCCKQQRIDRSSFIFFKSLHSCRYIKVYLNGKVRKAWLQLNWCTQVTQTLPHDFKSWLESTTRLNYHHSCRFSSRDIVPPFLWSSTTERVEIKGILPWRDMAPVIRTVNFQHWPRITNGDQ